MPHSLSPHSPEVDEILCQNDEQSIHLTSPFQTTYSPQTPGRGLSDSDGASYASIAPDQHNAHVYTSPPFEATIDLNFGTDQSISPISVRIGDIPKQEPELHETHHTDAEAFDISLTGLYDPEVDPWRVDLPGDESSFLAHLDILNMSLEETDDRGDDLGASKTDGCELSMPDDPAAVVIKQVLLFSPRMRPTKPCCFHSIG